MNKFIKILVGLAIFVGIVVVLLYAPTVATRYISTGAFTNLSSLALTQNIRTGGINDISTTSAAITLLPTHFYDIETQPYSIITILASTTATTTVALPASTTLSSFLPSAGDTVEVVISHGTSTGAFGLFLSGGTGTTIQKASTTAAMVKNGSIVFKFVRLTNTNILAIMGTPAQ